MSETTKPGRSAKATPADDYGADKIQVLEGLEAVRKRPGMYIGDTSDRGLHHLVYEIVDNSVDEAMAGHCTLIWVRVTADDGIVVTDDGRGIPTDIHAGTGLPGVTVALTKLHAGGKFDHGAYKVSGGLHGVGASVVNALSEELEVEVYRKGRVHFQSFRRGVPVAPLETRSKTDKHGTKVHFKPDPKIFQVTKFNAATLLSRLRELAFLNKGLTIRFTDERTDPPKDVTFKYDGGIREFVAWLNEGKEPLHDDVIYVEREDQGVRVEAALQFNAGYVEVVQSFANNIHTIEGGTHLSGFRTAVTRALLNYAKRESFFGKDDKPGGEDFREGLTAVVSVYVQEPQFEGQTKTKLGNSEVDGIVLSAAHDGIATYLEENPKKARAILDKAVQAFRAREAARKARDLVRRKGALASGNLPGKLADCSSRDVETTELFVVEGESAGGTAKMGRDRATQAILPLRGKILNVEKARIEKMLGHEEIRTLITAIGTGIGSDENGEGFDLAKCRYGKIVIMTDADVDGSHIRTLLLTFLFRHMQPLIAAGRIYVAQPPLFRLTHKKVGEYIFEERGLKERLQSLGTEGARVEPIGKKGEPIEGASLVRLVDALARLEELSRAVERRGLSMTAYLGAEKEGKYPIAVWRETKPGAELELVRSEEGLKRRLKELEAERKSEVKMFEEGDDPKLRETADVVVARIYEHGEIAKAAKVVEKAGLDPRAWWKPTNGEPAKPLWRLVSEGEAPVEISSLRELLAEVRKAGQRGVDVQRYKGLGEMNPEQLHATTMDPERRTLLQVRLPDAGEADRLFSLLMGEAVEPRKHFIETHALDVTNLDV
jgi:DNA gyrase subunit B